MVVIYTAYYMFFLMNRLGDKPSRVCWPILVMSLLCGWYQIVLLGLVQPGASPLKPANDRYPLSTLSNSLSSNLKVDTCTFQ